MTIVQLRSSNACYIELSEDGQARLDQVRGFQSLPSPRLRLADKHRGCGNPRSTIEHRCQKYRGMALITGVEYLAALAITVKQIGKKVIKA